MTEKQFKQKVREFLERTDCSISKLGNNEIVKYTQIAKLKDYFFEDKGSITMSVADRINEFIDGYGK